MKRVSSEAWLGGRKRGKPVDRQNLRGLLENVAISHQHLSYLVWKNKINTKLTNTQKIHANGPHVLSIVNAVFWTSFLLVDSLKGTN